MDNLKPVYKHYGNVFPDWRCQKIEVIKNIDIYITWPIKHLWLQLKSRNLCRLAAVIIRGKRRHCDGWNSSTESGAWTQYEPHYTQQKQQESRPNNEMNSFTDYFLIKMDRVIKKNNSKWIRNMKCLRKIENKITEQKDASSGVLFIA